MVILCNANIHNQVVFRSSYLFLQLPKLFNIGTILDCHVKPPSLN